MIRKTKIADKKKIKATNKKLMLLKADKIVLV